MRSTFSRGRNWRPTPVLLAVFVLHVVGFAQDLSSAKPESVGLSSERLERISTVVQRDIDDKRIASSELSSESRKIAAQMLRSRVSEFAGIDWPKAVAADLRKFLLQILERHIEKKLVTGKMLEKIDA